MAIPIIYRKAGEAAIASFNFTDIASATGYVSYYGGVLMSGANLKYRLSNNIFWSEYVQTNVSTSNEAFTKNIDIDFDIDFKVPQSIKGDVIANVPFAIYPDTASHTYSIFPVVRVRKYDGTTETEISLASGATLSYTPGAIGTYLYEIAAVLITTPQTHFKKDETLRITCELWTSDTLAGGTRHVILGHDPKNRATTTSIKEAYTFGTEPSNLIIQVPFKVDL